MSWIESGRAWGERAADWAYLMEPYARRANDALFDRADVGPGTRLLDIACGSGYAVSVASARGAVVAALDASQALIAIARALPFGEASLAHFLYLERPEGMERADAAGFVPAAPPPEPVAAGELMPRLQDFATVGHLYRGIEQGLDYLAGRLGERALFASPSRA